MDLHSFHCWMFGFCSSMTHNVSCFWHSRIHHLIRHLRHSLYLQFFRSKSCRRQLCASCVPTKEISRWHWLEYNFLCSIIIYAADTLLASTNGIWQVSKRRSNTASVHGCHICSFKKPIKLHSIFDNRWGYTKRSNINCQAYSPSRFVH